MFRIILNELKLELRLIGTELEKLSLDSNFWNLKSHFSQLESLWMDMVQILRKEENIVHKILLKI